MCSLQEIDVFMLGKKKNILWKNNPTYLLIGFDLIDFILFMQMEKFLLFIIEENINYSVDLYFILLHICISDVSSSYYPHNSKPVACRLFRTGNLDYWGAYFKLYSIKKDITLCNAFLY